ncbi:MAG: ATP-binding protein [Candidatus Solibacter sp.]
MSAITEKLSEVSEHDCCVPLNSDSLHDLVGPVNQLRAMTDLLIARTRGKLTGEDETVLGYMQASSERLQNLLSGLRVFTRVLTECQPYRWFDTNAALACALAGLDPQIRRNDVLLSHDALPETFGDPNQICFLFTTLLENSIKFRGESRPEIHVSALEQSDHTVFSVRDNGVGIDPSQCSRIFGVFKRIHQDAFPGAGVGLPIARRIVERHGGRIWVESTLGWGATFCFSMPNSESASAGVHSTL